MLKGNLTYIRPLEISDLDDLCNWYNNHEFSYWVSGNWPLTTLLRREEIEQKFYDEDDHRYAITDLTGNIIGSIGFDQFNIPARSARIYIGIGSKEYWGNGYGRDALNSFLHFLINQWNVHRITAETWCENKRAISCYQALGFMIEGQLREAYYIDGKYHDGLILGLLAKDFNNTMIPL